jgi:hypothetical protein
MSIPNKIIFFSEGSIEHTNVNNERLVVAIQQRALKIMFYLELLCLSIKNQVLNIRKHIALFELAL